MSKLIEKIIPEYCHNSFDFVGGKLFSTSDSDYCFLISSNGSSFLCDKEIAEEIVSGNPSEAVIVKLRNKGFEKGFHKFNIRESNIIMPRFFIIDFTTKCNMNCYYCLRHFEDEGEVISKDKLIEILDYIIEYCQQYNISSIEVQPWGGEPLIALDLICFMRDYLYAHNISANISVQTNGLLLNRENIIKLEKTNINIGVSVDGCDDIHNLHRKDLAGKDTFEKVIGNILDFQKITRKKVGTISVISKMSLPFIEKSIRALVERGQVQCFKFNLMHPNSDLFDISSVLSCDDIELFWKEVIKTILRVNEEGKRIIEYNIADRVYNLLTGGGGDICHSNGCTGGYNFISFNQFGEIYPCEMMGFPEFKIGDIHSSKNLPKAIKDSIQNGNPYFYAKKSEKCKSCEWEHFCKGGCTAAAKFNQKEIGEIDDKECATNQILYREIIHLILDKPDIATMLTDGKVEIW